MSDNLSKLSARKGYTPLMYERIAELAKQNPEGQTQGISATAKEFLTGEASVLGSLSFYDRYRQVISNKKVFVCSGTACMVSNTQTAVRSALERYFKDDEIGEKSCLGRCHETSAFQYNDVNYSGSDYYKLAEILQGPSSPLAHDQYRVRSNLSPAILTDCSRGFSYYTGLFEKMRALEAAQLIEEFQKSGLQGRGGAGFPFWKKLQACSCQASNPKFVVCNADEGDPGSFSDRFLIEQNPDAVLLGMITVAHIINANGAIIYIRDEYPYAIEAMQRTIGAWRDYFRQNQILNVPELFIVRGAGSYICGEETALLSSIEGQRPEVRIRPPYPTEKGLFGQPTLVNNVETLANIPVILDKGGLAYQKLGIPTATGVKLMCLDSLFNIPGIVEVEMGTPLKQVIYDLGGGFKIPVKAIQIGGPLGGIIPLAKVPDLLVDFQSFSDHGFDLGHASVVSIPEDLPIIHYLLHLFEFAAHESCGKCFPCRLGTQRGKELLNTAGEKGLNMELLNDLLFALKHGSLCGLGQALPIPVENALNYFSTEFEPYSQ